MKSLNGVIKTLIWINVFTAISALAIFILVRERRGVTATRSPSSESVTLGDGQPSRLLLEESGEERGETGRPPRWQWKMERLEQELARTREAVKALESRSRQPLPETSAEPRVNSRPAGATGQSVPAVSAVAPVATDDRPSSASRAARPDIPTVPEKSDSVETPDLPKVPESTRSEAREPSEIAMRPAGPLPPRFPADAAPNRAVVPSPNREPGATEEPAPVVSSPTTRQPLGQNPVARSNGKKIHSIRYANDIAYGLVVADGKGQINYGTTHYLRVQVAIIQLRRGEDIETAARRSSVPVATLQQLIKWGENRPGNLAALAEVGEPASRWQ